MKNYIILIILFFSVSSFSQSNNEIIFKKGIDNYNIGNYNESIENFLEIIKNGEHSKELYFNLGNCYYKINDIANSIYFYEKALKLDSNDIDIYNNLAFTQNMLIDKIDELPVNQLSNFFNIISNFFSINHWILIGIISLYLSLALFLLYFFKNDTKSKKKYFTFSSIFFCMTIISVLTGLTKHENQKSNIEAIITGILETSGSAFKVRNTDQPSISGIKISRVIASGLSSLAKRIPSLPFGAIMT